MPERSGEEAFLRLRDQLARALLADTKRVRELKLVSAERDVCGEFEITTWDVERTVVDVEEPLLPGTRLVQSEALPDVWTIKWPPVYVQELGPENINLRDCHVTGPCPSCGRTGVVRCGTCGGRGTVGNPQQRCGPCGGNGTVACARCRQAGMLLTFKRIVQRVFQSKDTVTFPTGTARVSRGEASGQVEFGTALGFSDAAAVLAAMSSASEEAASLPWHDELATAVANPLRPNERRIGWRSVKGRWYNGSRLRCVTKRKELAYFVPDSDATVVGPKLRSPAKLTVVGVIAGCLLVSLVLVINWKVKVAAAETYKRRAVAAEQTVQRERAEAQAAAVRRLAEQREREQREAEARAQKERDYQDEIRAFIKGRVGVTKEVALLESLVRKKKWFGARGQLGLVGMTIETVRSGSTPVTEPWAVALERRVAKQRAVIEVENQRQAKEAERNREATRAMERIRGEKPAQSAWNGSVVAVDQAS